MKAVIPVAGYGTRFLPATKAQPKEMLAVYDKPALQYIVEEAIASGLDDIVVVTGRNKRSIEDHFDRSYELEYTLQRAGKDRDLKKIRKITDLADICYVRQKEQIGLGDAIKCCENHIGDEPFALFLGHTVTKSQTPCMKQLIDIHEKYQKSVVGLSKVKKDQTHRFKIIKGNKIEDNIYKINKTLENPKTPPSDLAVIGRYILTPDIFDKINTHKVSCDEIHLTNALKRLDAIYGVEVEGRTHYIENRLEWLKTSISFALDDEEFREELINYMNTYI